MTDPLGDATPTRDKLPPPDLLRETVTLAHEAGHYLSWKGRTPPDEYDKYFNAAKLRDQASHAVPKSGNVEEYNEGIREAARAALSSAQVEMIFAEGTARLEDRERAPGRTRV